MIGTLTSPNEIAPLHIDRAICLHSGRPGGADRAAQAAGGHDAVAEAARNHGVSPQQVALAWLLSLSQVVIPIPGASRPESIQDSVKAAGLALGADELRALGQIAQRVH